MHTFCLGLPFGALVVLGGLIGAISKGSIMSLLAGGGSGLALCGLSYLCLQEFKRAKSAEGGRYTAKEEEKIKLDATRKTDLYNGIQAAICAVLVMVMGMRYNSSGKFMPAGLVAGLSGAMLAFFIFRLVSPSDLTNLS